ncbi:MAG: leucine-rich repeat domain-containing protein [Bacteroidaceae bacterium]|nr:leucine-rich repeat domain-containing protein [Bacteroidaceae bacterium]
MKNKLLLLILTFLPMCAWSQLIAELDGIYFNIFTNSKTAEVIASTNKYSGNIVIPNDIKFEGNTYIVTSIAEKAFADCNKLTSIEIPSDVTSIGKQAFAGCKNLNSIIIPNYVTTIENKTFSNCSKLKKIEIGYSVNNISSGAFQNCSELTDVYCYAEKIPMTDQAAFKNSYVNDVTLHVPAKSVDIYKKKAPWNEFGKIVALSNEEMPIIKPIPPKPITIISSQISDEKKDNNDVKKNEDANINEADDGITIKALVSINSSNVNLNDIKPFFTVVNAPNKDLIGCPVTCKVLQVRKSNISGSEGRLIIRPLYINKGGEKIKVSGDIHVRGLNRSNFKFWLSFLPPVWFIPGTGAKIEDSDRFVIYPR